MIFCAELERFELSSFCPISGRPVAVVFGTVGELPCGGWANEEGFSRILE